MGLTHPRSIEIHLDVVVKVNGDDYYLSDWDGDEEAFRAEMKSAARPTSTPKR